MSHPTEFAPFAVHIRSQAHGHGPYRHLRLSNPAAPLAKLNHIFAQLQERLADPDLASLRPPVAQLAHLCREMEDAVRESIPHLAHAQLGLESMIDLLACLGDDVRLPSSRLKELLAPLVKRMDQPLHLLTRAL
ncbi:DUF1484 family protein [Chromobacterium violaceum]|uniref:DUF1484 family protein n=1 Tax=Chromobacterium violaceum TaxID=536 RepID=UPI0009DA15D5|nr:DUF1484 family protein [Chromobacterium violaceum]OQS50639.1 DUF1484 domain-containing protein [Chromobacterium violaceum]OQS52824.1 DUF1484 domain-containing protein [Chromobacterium violaceum]QRO31682.1 DUF1484 family protein [Chromobacterium violaceum]QRQ18518.1 DUF1484 family protein [Chromobacterium violaceum]